MKMIFKTGDLKQYKRIVQADDVAAFQGKVVHPVCSTFSLARDIEWTTRQFVLDMRDDDEEGIGTYLSIDHKGPAFPGEEITVTAYVEEIKGHELICSYVAKVGDRLVAAGRTGQKILKRTKINTLFAKP
jgi:predicted thioesterase